MLKKSLAVSLTAALLVTGPGRSAAWAVANVSRPVAVPRLNAPAMTVFSAPNLAPLSGSLLSAPSLVTPALIAPAAAPLAAAPVMPLAAPAAAVAPATALHAVTGAVETLAAPNASPDAQTGALSDLYSEGLQARTGFEAFDVLGQAAANDAPLSPASQAKAASRASVPAASVKNGGLVMEAAGVAGVVLVVLLAIKQSRALIMRAVSAVGIMIGNAFRGMRSTQSLRDAIFKELEEGRDKYNNEVLRADASFEAKKLELDGLKKQDGEFETKIGEKLSALQAAGGETTPAGKVLKQAARDLVRDQEMVKKSITATEGDLGKLETALAKAKADRQSFFYTRADRLQELKSGMTAEEIGLADSRLASMKTKYVLDGEERMAEVGGRVAKTVAQGKAAQDVVNSDPREQKRAANERLEERNVDDALEARLKKLNEGGAKNGGAIELKHLIHFAEALAVIGSFFFPLYAAVGVLGTALVSMAVSPSAQQWLGRRLALIGLGTLAVGGLPLLLAKTVGFTGIIGFGTTLGFIIPGVAAVIAGFGIAYKGYLSSKKAAVAAPVVAEQPIVVPVIVPAPVAAQPVAQPSGPSRLEQGAEIARRAGDAAGKLADTGVKAAGQAADAALGAADKGVAGLEQLADKAAASVGTSTSKDAVPEVGAIAKRLRDVSLRLAEAGVAKVEQASGMKQGDPVPSAPSLISRLWNALMVIFGNQVAKLETPEVLAQQLLNTLAAAEKTQRQAVYDAALEYRTIEGRLDAARAEAKKAEDKVNRLLKPRVDGKPISAEDEAAAKLFIADLRLAELTVAGNLEQLAVALGQRELAIKRRAEIFADRAEALVAVRSGLSKAQLAALRGSLAQAEQEYESGVAELTREFEAKVADAVAAGQASQDAADSDPLAIKRRAERRMSEETVDAELERRKAALSAGSANNGGSVTNLEYPALLGLTGAALVVMNPLTGVVIALTLGALTLGDSILSKRNGMAFNNAGMRDKFIGFAIGTGIASGTLIALGAAPLWALAAPGVGLLLAAVHHYSAR